MDKDLQQLPSVGATWAAPAPEVMVPVFSVTLTINVPTHAKVSRNTLTGQVQFEEILIEDLENLRDSIDQQIVMLREEERRLMADTWEPL